MPKSIKEYGQNKIGFVFEKGKLKGERYSGTFEICSNPYCRCGIVSLDLTLEEDKAEPPRYKFAVDVFKKKVDNGGGFTNYFIKDLSKDDWDTLRTIYWEYKRLRTETCPIEEIDAVFPMEEIEKSDIMVGFYEILPYAESLVLEVGDERFFVDDQYCLKSSCPCTNVALGFVPLGNKKVRSYTTIILNYRDNSWRLERLERNTAASPEELMNELFRQELSSVFIKRHEKLKVIYKQFKKKYCPDGPLSSKEKIGRNEPCPCGSGKKYKKCCLGKEFK